MPSWVAHPPMALIWLIKTIRHVQNHQNKITMQLVKSYSRSARGCDALNQQVQHCSYIIVELQFSILFFLRINMRRRKRSLTLSEQCESIIGWHPCAWNKSEFGLGPAVLLLCNTTVSFCAFVSMGFPLVFLLVACTFSCSVRTFCSLVFAYILERFPG